MFEKANWFRKTWKTYYAEGEGTPLPPPPVTPPVTPEPDGNAIDGDLMEGIKPIDGKFSQDHINAILARDRRKHQSAYAKVMSEFEALKSKSTLTAQERSELEERLQGVQKDLLTKEELAKDKMTKLEKKHKDAVDSLTKERDSWQHRFTESTIARSLFDSAIENNAYSPEQILAILRPSTRLVEALDDEGKPTGEMVPKVAFKDIKDNKPINLELTPSEAVKKMREMEKYLNLFKGEGVGGLGLQNRGGGSGTGVDLKELAKDPAAWAKARKDGKVKLT